MLCSAVEHISQVQTLDIHCFYWSHWHSLFSLGSIGIHCFYRSHWHSLFSIGAIGIHCFYWSHWHSLFALEPLAFILSIGAIGIYSFYWSHWHLLEQRHASCAIINVCLHSSNCPQQQQQLEGSESSSSRYKLMKHTRLTGWVVHWH